MLQTIINFVEKIIFSAIWPSFAGSILAAIINSWQNKKQEKKNYFTPFFICVCTGVATSVYLAPWIASLIGAKDFIGGVSFLCGLFAMNLAQTVIEGLKSGEFKAAILSWLTKG